MKDLESDYLPVPVPVISKTMIEQSYSVNYLINYIIPKIGPPTTLTLAITPRTVPSPDPLHRLAAELDRQCRLCLRMIVY